MRKLLSFSFLFTVLCNFYAQELHITLSGHKDFEKVSMDSVLIENITQEKKLSIKTKGGEKVFIIEVCNIDFSAAINDKNVLSQSIQFIHNKPGFAKVCFETTQTKIADIAIHTINGQLLFRERATVGPSNNSLNIEIPFQGVYIINVQTDSDQNSFKVLGGLTGGKVEIQATMLKTIHESSMKSAHLEDVSSFFRINDSLQFTGYYQSLSSTPIKRLIRENVKRMGGSLVFDKEGNNSTLTDSLNLLSSEAFELWRDCWIHSRGLFYDTSVTGSDSERHPERYTDQQRHFPEGFYGEGTFTFPIEYASHPWDNAYMIIKRCNQIITRLDSSRNTPFNSGEEASIMNRLYNGAIALRATIYFELCRYFGDVPHIVSLDTTLSLVSRDEIYEFHINKLREIEPLMSRVGEEDYLATKMTRTYVQGLIGSMCLYAGGFATRRTDLPAEFYKNLNGETLQFIQLGDHYSGGKYTRRTDYLDFYKIARLYLSECVANSGSVHFLTKDPRPIGPHGEKFGNPFQYIFQQMNNLEISDESIYEIEEYQYIYSERPYAFGRPSNGRGANSYPCKSYAQSRFYPTYYYADFNPHDLRRDVTVAVTGSTGSGVETMIGLAPGNKAGGGGFANNKWDENRMPVPVTTSQRAAGINNPYMRMSDVILMLAEVYAELGEEENAKTELAKVHNRAFENEELANLDGFITKMGGIKRAILEERKLEFGGEGLRRWDLIRTGILDSAIVSLKSKLTQMLSELKANGYATFENGNQFPSYIWIKAIDAQALYGYRLTTQSPNEDDPFKYPGWRGQYNDWRSMAEKHCDEHAIIEEELTNLAIKGLFRYIDPNGEEAKNLEEEGYERHRWGADIVGTKLPDERNIDPVDYSIEYTEYVFKGHKPNKAPIYMFPIPAKTIEASDGKVTNGYGFVNSSDW